MSTFRPSLLAAAAALAFSAGAQAQTFSTDFSSGAQGSFTSYVANGATVAALNAGPFSLSGLVLDQASDAPEFGFSLAGLSDLTISFDFIGANLLAGGGAPRLLFSGAPSPITLFTTPIGFGGFSATFANLAAGSYTLGFAVGNFDKLGIDNLSVQVTAVPEPATMALMAAGLGVVGWAAKRRRAQPGSVA